MSSAIVFETHSITDDNELEFATGWLLGRLSATGRERAQDLRRRRRGDGLSAVADLRACVLPTVTQTGSVNLDGARLAWTRSGRRGRAAPSVLLAHGITDSAVTWDRVATGLAPSYDVVRYDARGHGLSDRATSYPFELHAGDLMGLSRALRLDRPVLIGHSTGGAVATVAAAELDARALILEDPHWPEIPEDDTSHDVAAGRRKLAEVAALPEAGRWAHGRSEHPNWADVDLGAWVRPVPERLAWCTVSPGRHGGPSPCSPRSGTAISTGNAVAGARFG